MDYQAQYQAKLRTIAEELQSLRDGDVVCCGTELCEPTGFFENLHTEAFRLRDVEIIKSRRGSGHVYPFMEMPELAGHVRLICHFYDGALRQCHERGIASHLPSNLHDFLKRRTEYKPVINKFIAEATPMDENGNFCISGSGMLEEEALARAQTVILEVNHNQPKFPGSLVVPLGKVDMIVEVDEPTRYYDVRSTPGETDLIIGAYVADLVHDGDCIQLGLGGMPDAVGNAFFEKKDLGLHTEMFTPVMGDLIEAGVITGARKNVDTGIHVGNFTLGDRKLYDILSGNPHVQFRQASYTNDPFVISQIDNMVSINTALEIDLSGQICSESIGSRQYSGTGGAFDFAYGAQHSRGGRSIIAMSSTAKGGTMTKIRDKLTSGAVVSIPRNVADIIVTEYGVAYMRGRTISERARQLIAIAHPDFREELRAAAREMGYIG